MKKLALLFAMIILQSTLFGVSVLQACADEGKSSSSGTPQSQRSSQSEGSSPSEGSSLSPGSSQNIPQDDSTQTKPGQQELRLPNKPIQGRVIKAGSLMRLARPTLQSYQSGNPNSDSSNSKKPVDARYLGSVNQDLLKARVLEAAGMKPMTPMSGVRSKYETFKLSANELRALSQYDICVMLDASGSMSRDDCVSINSFIMEDRVSRWDWCGEQSELLTQQIFNAFPKGITVIPFASTAKRFTNVFPSTINDIFREIGPAGATRLDLALDLEFESFLSDRRFGIKRKPLLVAIISDGVPTAPHLVTRQILELSNMISPNEVRIVFFLIGTAPTGSYYINLLSNIRKSDGTKCNLVSSRPFTELCQIGLPRSLAQTVQSFEPK